MTEEAVIALVTGASAGLGQEFCRQLAPRCDRIIAVARRGDRLQSLAEELSGQTELYPLEADLKSVEGVSRTLEALRQKGPVQILVNNAGFSTFGEFPDLPIDGQRDMITLHTSATITLCRAAIPFMRELGRGQIINVSSLGGFLPGKGLAVYGATKAFLNYFSLALQAEVSGTGVEVQALCPGYIRTEFHAQIFGQGFDPSRIPEEMWSEPGDVVTASLEALGSGRVLVLPGKVAQDLAKFGLQGQLDRLAAVQ